MSTIYEIPLDKGQPQSILISLGGTQYRLTFRYIDNTDQGGWIVDIYSAANAAIVRGIPLVTGADLLAQYAYLGFKGKLQVQTITNPSAPPTFDNLGDDGKVFWVAP